ncbi:MauE/DoxX family redox-associated membrane protein [Pseudomarimonas salicorniae]|uniref:Methylamine utilization protein MauE n=1 Tax=Pseudomarimonas salicorniae TaxID=2933270 RepID=A0ABT0GGL8_9GAMM|nr:MauE/DoxX family redox-associated membrane protein [Lysobacter sp. CAU 1642]MCK7593676.1 glutaredoxin [Lysobacter sp. CAU 1642]
MPPRYLVPELAEGSAGQATLYRMATPDHLCPFGLKALHLLRRRGYQVEDHTLDSRDETDAFQQEHGVETTPQVFIGGERIGGYDDLRRHFGLKVRDPEAEGYGPVVALFSLAGLGALALAWADDGPLLQPRTLAFFAALSMLLLALQKLRDVESFTNSFLGYDLLARRWVPYAYLYPFAEAAAGLLMLAGDVLATLAAPIALFIGAVGAFSVIRAVWIEGRELRCACMGGDSQVPLGPVSLAENLLMVGAGLWMLPGGPW